MRCDKLDNKNKYLILIFILIGNFLFTYSTFNGNFSSYLFNEFIWLILYQSGLIITLFYILSGIWKNKVLCILSCAFMILLVFRIWNHLMIHNILGFIVDLGGFILLSWFLLPNVILNIAKFMTERGKFINSIKLCDFCINYFGGSYWPYLINGHNFIEIKDYEKAITYFKKCLTYDIDSYDKTLIYTELGICYFNIENFEKSLCYYEKVSETEFDELLYYGLKGKILSLSCLERYDEANDCIEESLKIYENDEGILNMKEMLTDHLKEKNKI